MTETPRSINRFWFGEHLDDAAAAKAQASLWWKKNTQVDEQIKHRFGDYVRQAASGKLDAWAEEPPERLALILLSDQFPRHIYRGMAQAFSLDHLAQAWTKEGLALRADEALRPIERVFFYLPLEHSESLDHQEQAVQLFQALKASVPADVQPVFQGFLDYAIRHRDVIARFGRFPHRNAKLGRPSTEEEIIFLKQPGSSF